MKNTILTGFETTDRMRGDSQKVFDGEYNIPIDFEAPIVLDIGACHGAFALWAQARWEGAQVTCYEPATDALTLLCRNMDGQDVNIEGAAVSASGKATMPLYYGVNAEGANSLYSNVVPVYEKCEQVPVIDPSTLPPCDVLKMDCEGSEWEIVENYRHLDSVSAVLLEYHSEENCNAIDAKLVSVGFKRIVNRPTIAGLGIACYVQAAVLQEFYERFQTRVLIVSPIYKGEGHPQFLNSVSSTLDHLKENNIYASYSSVHGDAHIDRARAGLLGSFLSEPYWTHILMVDSDIEWHPTVITALLDHSKPCIGAAYPFKADSGPLHDSPVLRAWGARSTSNEEGLVAMRYLGGGFILCERDLIERMCEAEPHLKFDTNPGHGMGHQMETYALWQAVIIDQPEWGEGKKEMLSEDYSFCERVNRLGETCWLDIHAQLAHWDGDKAHILEDRSKAA